MANHLNEQIKWCKHLIEKIKCWQAGRTMLAHHVELWETGQMHTGVVTLGDSVVSDIQRTKSWIAELEWCIAEFTAALARELATIFGNHS
jgi:hypothetical protein